MNSAGKHITPYPTCLMDDQLAGADMTMHKPVDDDTRSNDISGDDGRFSNEQIFLGKNGTYLQARQLLMIPFGTQQ